MSQGLHAKRGDQYHEGRAHSAGYLPFQVPG
jgi:hypothetical protein